MQPTRRRCQHAGSAPVAAHGGKNGRVRGGRPSAGGADGKPTIIDDVDREGADGDLDAAAFLLYRKAGRPGTWQPSTIDLSRDRADLDRLNEQHCAYLERFAAAFLNAEENVARLFGPWVMAAPGRWIQAFFSTQLLEEFKHTEFFYRYFGEVLGHRDFKTALANPVQESLAARSRRLLQTLDAGEVTRTIAEYLPLIRVRYGQKMQVDGRAYDPPEEERGVERLMTFYNRCLEDIFRRRLKEEMCACREIPTFRRNVIH